VARARAAEAVAVDAAAMVVVVVADSAVRAVTDPSAGQAPFVRLVERYILCSMVSIKRVG
jgi:hypothetical protein